MSVSDEEPYSTILASLKHPIRRRILRMLSKEPMSFSEMLGVLGVSSSFLNYHLENLGELVGKIDDGRYKLSSFGEAAMSTMTKVEDIPTTTLHQSPETRPKKIVGRNVAIALGIICILLVSGLGGAIAYYTMTINNKNATYDNYVSSHSHSNSDYDSLNSQVGNLQNQNGNLQTWLNGNETLLNQLQTWLSGNETLLKQIEMWLNGNVTAYNQIQHEVSSIYISGTTNSTVLVNNETVYEIFLQLPLFNETGSFVNLPTWDLGTFPSAGYVAVLFSSDSTTNSVSISHGNPTNKLEFDAGSSGIIVFPVLPSTDYSMFLYNSLGKNSVFTVTITYYY